MRQQVKVGGVLPLITAGEFEDNNVSKEQLDPKHLGNEPARPPF